MRFRFDVLKSVYTIQPVVKPVVELVWQPVWQPCWTNSCSFSRLWNRVVQPDWQPAVYTIQPFCQTGCQTGLTTGWMFVYTTQPVVKPAWQPVWQQVLSCKRGFIIMYQIVFCFRLVSLSSSPFNGLNYCTSGLYYYGRQCGIGLVTGNIVTSGISSTPTCTDCLFTVTCQTCIYFAEFNAVRLSLEVGGSWKFITVRLAIHIPV